jgi:hypothetical protein
MNTSFWNMDSGLAATRRPGMTMLLVRGWCVRVQELCVLQLLP